MTRTLGAFCQDPGAKIKYRFHIMQSLLTRFAVQTILLGCGATKSSSMCYIVVLPNWVHTFWNVQNREIHTYNSTVPTIHSCIKVAIVVH